MSTSEGHATASQPSIEDATPSTYASYVPHDLKYSNIFEDELVGTVLNSGEAGDANNGDISRKLGIRVIPADSKEDPVSGVSVRAADIDIKSLPAIREDELPLSLNDPRRIYASSIPGIRLTHPGGYLEGGPGLDPPMDTFSDDFLSKNESTINSPTALQEAINKEIQANVEILKERLEARRRAKEKNEQIERDMKVLTDQHDMELRIQSRMAEERREKKEAKEKSKGRG